jgi:Predicted ATPase (AAA+ superfamily)
MAISNRDRVGKALELLSAGLKPYVERTMAATYGPRWRYEAVTALRDYHISDDGQDLRLEDVQALLQIMLKHWNAAFRNTLGHAERSYVSLLLGVRNEWAHMQPMLTDEAYRALDQMQMLLEAISANEQAEQIAVQKKELMRTSYDGQVRTLRRKSGPLVEGQIPRGLLPWREIITPHHDVAAGNYQVAEFAADLWRVFHDREGAPREYSDPQAFFERTYLTNGLKQLLLGALRRLSGNSGDPIVELQTNFGGGKTHSLLALYHLFSDVTTTSLVGMEPLLREVGIQQAPSTKRAVLVGHALSPAQVRLKPDGCEVHTLWGELAWQLLGRQGYEMVLDDDLAGTSPGSETLRQLFVAAGPTLVLIDEWVVFVRQLYKPKDMSETYLPAGSFEANMSFVQNLTEAAKAAPQTLVVASIPGSDSELGGEGRQEAATRARQIFGNIPGSDSELGGEGGQEAAIRLRQIFGRVESPWRPADPEEGFEIVRRRLFEDVPQRFSASRDAVARAFGEYYREQRSEFPTACSQLDYERRIIECYPIHPELFDRLFSDWSSIPKFQRTRGVLRLMAAVIHELWIQQDKSLLIMPASIPVDTTAIQSMFVQYLEDNWVPIIDKDVDGPRSLSRELDNNNANFGRYSAARRVARTVFFSATPTIRGANKGIQDTFIKLGCAQPSESVAVFGDALRRLAEQATYLYQNDRRYWYDTQASVTRIAQDKAAQYDDETVYAQIKRSLMVEQRNKGDFASVHICPDSSADVLDENSGVRLVLLKPRYPHARKDANSEAMTEAMQLLNQRGSAPRLYRNTLIFLVADRTRVDELTEATRSFLAWDAIEQEHEALNLDAFQWSQTKKRRQSAEERVVALIPETYCWILVPEQPDVHKKDTLSENKLTPQQGKALLATNVSSWLRTEEYLITQLAGLRLKQELDRVLWQQNDHVSVKDLVEYFARYVYLPRLKNKDVLLKAIQDGVASDSWREDTFAYAAGWDEQGQRYRDLRVHCHIDVIVDGQSLLVKSEIAERQLEQEEAERRRKEAERLARLAQANGADPATSVGGHILREGGIPYGSGPTQYGQGSYGGGASYNGGTPVPPVAPPPQPRQISRYYGSVQLNERLMGTEASRIMDEIVQHLTSLNGAHVTVTLDIQATAPDGIPEKTIGTIKENGNTLHFTTSEFSEE